jgi:phosphoglycolate phosphatase
MKRLAIFDCDGTLVDSQHNICRAMHLCFDSAGLEPPEPDRTRKVVGLSLVEAMRALLPDARAELHLRLAEDYKRAFRQMRSDGLADEPLYDGVRDLLDRLQSEGWLLGIATGKSDRGLALCLEHHGLLSRFVTLQTADRHPSKPDPSMIAMALAETGAEPEASLMIGDTSFDMMMARAAGVAAIGVGWGYHDVNELRQAGADHVSANPLDIIDHLKAAA